MTNVADNSIHGLGLCGGALGLELGIEAALPGYQTVCVVEREIAIAARIAARIVEGSLPPLALWDDVSTFDGRPWRGIVDIISAEFPCQPWSVAGKRQGTNDQRWIWPDIARIVAEVDPAVVFFENVPGLLLDADRDVDRWAMDEQPVDALGGMGTVLRDLARLCFDAEWISLRAADLGAAHGRKRVFILGVANTRRARKWWSSQQARIYRPGSPDDGSGTSGALENARRIAGGRWPVAGTTESGRDHGPPERAGHTLADSGCGQLPEPERRPEGGGGSGPAGPPLANADSYSGTGLPLREGTQEPELGQHHQELANADSDRRQEHGWPPGEPVFTENERSVGDATGGGRGERGKPSGSERQLDGPDAILANAPRPGEHGPERESRRTGWRGICEALLGIFAPGPTDPKMGRRAGVVPLVAAFPLTGGGSIHFSRRG